jgi:hypothetical protein
VQWLDLVGNSSAILAVARAILNWDVHCVAVAIFSCIDGRKITPSATNVVRRPRKNRRLLSRRWFDPRVFV